MKSCNCLDKSEVTTGILYDRVYPMANLTGFNQTEADTATARHFYHGYAGLQTARDKHRYYGKTRIFTLFSTKKTRDYLAISQKMLYLC